MIKPYEGDKPYAFISYAHKDEEKVFPIIEAMQEKGYRVWYDEGIDPGTEWDENIAEHIDRASHVIAFMSENYLASKNCKDELGYARDLDRRRLLVYLEDVTLPRGMQMRLGRVQAIYECRYGNKEDFYEKLWAAKDIGLCRRKTETVSDRAGSLHEADAAAVSRETYTEAEASKTDAAEDVPVSDTAYPSKFGPIRKMFLPELFRYYWDTLMTTDMNLPIAHGIFYFGFWVYVSCVGLHLAYDTPEIQAIFGVNPVVRVIYMIVGGLFIFTLTLFLGMRLFARVFIAKEISLCGKLRWKRFGPLLEEFLFGFLLMFIAFMAMLAYLLLVYLIPAGQEFVADMEAFFATIDQAV